MEYAILVLPNHNRVYRDQAPELAKAELKVLNTTVLGGKLTGISPDRVGGMPCLNFSGPALAEGELSYFSALSFRYGFFAREGELFRALEVPEPKYFQDDILSILKYSGKTNEAFTALLYNVTLWAGAFAGDFNSRLRVLDPVCGRGTTIYYGLYRGHDVDGVEVAKADVQAVDEFFSRYLKEHRFKHSIDRGRFKRRQGGMGKKIFVQGAPDKDILKSDPFSCMVVGDDTVNVNDHYAKNTYHAIVADLPYGVQHGGSGPGRGYIKIEDLLIRALPGWTKVLKGGGSMGLSWNAKSVPRHELTGLLGKAGLEVLDGEPFTEFRHRVDQAVERDLVVAIKQ